VDGGVGEVDGTAPDVVVFLVLLGETDEFVEA
jgi:hypothetical protein